MNHTISLLICLSLVSLVSCTQVRDDIEIASPGNINIIEFGLSEEGSAYYRVKHKNRTVIDTSSMDFDFKYQPPLKNGLRIIGISTRTVDETWEMPWGEQRTVRNHSNELIVRLKETAFPKRLWNICFRAYDDGIGFRYEFPAQDDADSLVIMNENTAFRLTGDHTCWWIPGDWDIYEHLYHTTPLSKIDATALRDNENLAQTWIPENAVNTPVTMRTEAGLYLSFHEAALTDYAGMTLRVDNDQWMLKSALVGSDRLGYKVKRSLPFKTPWRTVQIADKAADLIESRMILNLNEPNKIGDVGWFKPKKYVGVWWEMHIGLSSWDLASGNHGATTENAKRYIDFAEANNIKGVLIEGWNTGWEHWIGFEDREGVFDFVTPYPDYSLEEVIRYAKEKGIKIIMHHETSAAPRTYEAQLDTAYSLMRRLGIHTVKTGYVGTIIPKGEYHHGQWMVNHYRHVLEKAAAYQIAVNIHEPIKATGIRRTYPNAVSREGVRGQEYNAWASDGGNPPEHTPIVVFTRMLAGPIDFTPGVLNIELPLKEHNQINTTLAKQLALYVAIYSPIQMACDLPENYIDQPAFQFIRDVGVDWEQTVVINGEVGDYVTVAREERKTGHWFVGSITDENQREITIPFNFLIPGKTYQARFYQDGANAHYRDNPLDITIVEMEITSETIKTFTLAPGGGLAISLK